MVGATYGGYLIIHYYYMVGATYGGYLWGLPNNSIKLRDGGLPDRLLHLRDGGYLWGLPNNSLQLRDGGYLITQYYYVMGAT